MIEEMRAINRKLTDIFYDDIETDERGWTTRFGLAELAVFLEMKESGHQAETVAIAKDAFDKMQSAAEDLIQALDAILAEERKAA